MLRGRRIGSEEKKGKINVNDDLLELVGRRKSNTAEARLNKSIRA